MEYLPCSREMIMNYFSSSAYKRGRDYFHANKVKALKIQADPTTNAIINLTGKVKGSYSPFYDVTVDLDDAGEILNTECDCPIGADCKHAVALILKAMANFEKSPPVFQQMTQARPSPVPVQMPAEKQALDHVTERWLTRINKLTQAISNPDGYAADVKERLLYVVKKKDEQNYSGYEIEVCFYQARKLQTGEYGGFKLLTTIILTSTARYIAAADREILDLLAIVKKKLYSAYTALPLEGAAGEKLFKLMLQTGRCYWNTPEGPALKIGESRPLNLEWRMQNNGEQSLTGLFEQPETIVLALTPPWYVDQKTGETGLILTDLPGMLLTELLLAPAIKLYEVEKVKKMLTELLPANAVPLPTDFTQKKLTQIKPTPHLRLYAEAVDQPYWHSGFNQVMSYADLSFDYKGVQALFGDDKPVINITGQVMEIIRRQHTIENAAAKKLRSFGLTQLKHFSYQNSAHIFIFTGPENTHAWMEFTLEKIPQLQAEGWQITIEPSFPHRYVQAAESEWYSELTEESSNQWFDLELGIILDNERINLLPLLLKAIQQLPEQFTAAAIEKMTPAAKIVAPLEDGRKLLLPMARIKPILQVLTELFDPAIILDNGKLQLSALRSAQLEELTAAAGDAARFRWLGGERLLAIGKKLRNFSSITPVEPPTDFNATLRPYQREGLNWLQFLREYNLAGILADDMGLGKTVQTLAHILLEKQSGRLKQPVLVIAPTSLMFNWRREAETFAPALSVLTLHGAQRKEDFKHIQHYDLILTTYPLIVRDEKILLQQEYYLIVLDEAQIIKNAKAKVTQLVQLLQAQHRLCLTGTPMENNLGELWSLFNFVLPGLLGEAKQFQRLYRVPIEKHQDAERRQNLSRRIAPFLLRRTKQAVVKDLPQKIEMMRHTELTGAQRDLYESVRLAMHEKVAAAIRSKGLARSHIIILDALLKLRQICCNPRLLKLSMIKKSKTPAASAKLQLLLEMLPELLAEGRQILLFSQFTEMLSLIEQALLANKINYVKLTGQTVDRIKPIQLFQAGEVKLFLISLKAGGVGLNLTAADTVIHYDPWWNPAVEQQATDRAHRIGQTKTVFVYKLITAGTVEEKIVALQERKRELMQGLFSENAADKKHLSAADLTELFAAQWEE